MIIALRIYSCYVHYATRKPQLFVVKIPRDIRPAKHGLETARLHTLLEVLPRY